MMPILIIATIFIIINKLIRIIKLVTMEYVVFVVRNIKIFIISVIITMVIMEYAYNVLRR